MGRLWLALAMIVALVGTVFADGNPVCTCAAPRVLPAPGSVGVPTNARLWRLPTTSAPDQPIASYELAPHTHYEIRDGGTSFTTGAGPDPAAPVEPAVARVTITVANSGNAGRKPVAVLRVASMMDADVAVVRLTFEDALGVVTYYTTPDALTVCDPNIDLTAGPVRVTLTALDLAGHASLSQTIDTEATVDRSYKPRCHGPYDSPLGMLWYLATCGLVLAIFVGLLMYLFVLRDRAAVRARTERMPMAFTAVEALARTMRFRALALLATIAGLAAIATTSNNVVVAILGDAALPAAALGAIAAAIALSRTIAATRALSLLRYDGVTAEAQHDQVVITVGKRDVTLRTSPRLVERSRRHALPRATL